MYLFEKKIEYNVSTAGIRILHIHTLKRYIRVYKNLYNVPRTNWNMYHQP